MKNTILPITQIIISLLLITFILLQNKGAGLSQVFGGSDSYSYRTKRGLEKILSRLTIILITILIGTSIAVLIIK
jgi:protein translocase SecG subunit